MSPTAIDLELDQLVGEMVARKIPREKAIAAARAHLGRPDPEIPNALLGADAREGEHETAGDRLMQGLGFVVVRLSQRRKSKVTAGIPDRYYVHERRRLVVWWEAKTSNGRASPEQLQFARLHQRAGVNHVLGTIDALKQWLVDNQVATFDASGLPEPIPFEERACTTIPE